MMRRDEDLADGKDWVGGTEKSVGVEEFEIVANDADLEEEARPGRGRRRALELCALDSGQSQEESGLHCTVLHCS